MYKEYEHVDHPSHYNNYSMAVVGTPTNSPLKMPLNTHLKIWFSYE